MDLGHEWLSFQTSVVNLDKVLVDLLHRSDESSCLPWPLPLGYLWLVPTEFWFDFANGTLRLIIEPDRNIPPKVYLTLADRASYSSGRSELLPMDDWDEKLKEYLEP